MMAHRRRAASMGGVLALAAALATCSEPEGPDPEALALYASLGAYAVRPMGLPPGATSVSFSDINDSGTVVGYATGGQSSAFRWTNGVYEILGSNGGGARATGINNRGDVVGMNGIAVIWPAGSTQPVEIAPPESTTYRMGEVVEVTDDGRIVYFLSSARAAVVTRSPFKAVSGYPFMASPKATSGSGLIAFVYTYPLLPVVRVWDTATNTICDFAMRAANAPVAMSDSGQLLYSTTFTRSETSYWLGRFVPGTTCGGQISVAERVSKMDFRSVNNHRVITGLIDGVPSAGIAGTPTFVPLDEVLRRSGNGAEKWHVTDVYRVSNADIFVVSAQRTGESPQLVLLVPVGR